MYVLHFYPVYYDDLGADIMSFHDYASVPQSVKAKKQAGSKLRRKARKRVTAASNFTAGKQVNAIMSDSSLRHQIEGYLLHEARVQAKSLRNKKLGYVSSLCVSLLSQLAVLMQYICT